MIKNISIKTQHAKMPKWYHFDDTKINEATLKKYLKTLKDVSEFLLPERNPMAEQTLYFDTSEDIITVTETNTDSEKSQYARGKVLDIIELNEKPLTTSEKFNIYIDRLRTTPERMSDLIKSEGAYLAINEDATHSLLEGRKYRTDKELRHYYHGAEFIRFPIIFCENGHIAFAADDVQPQSYIFFSKKEFRTINPLMKLTKVEIVQNEIELMFHDLVNKINAYVDNNVFCCTIVSSDNGKHSVDIIDNIVATDIKDLKETVIERTIFPKDKIKTAISKRKLPNKITNNI